MGKQKRQANKPLSNLKVALIISLTACLNIIIALGALVLGLWIDNYMGWRGFATVTLILVSFPISLYLMVRLALMSVKRFGTSTDSYVVDNLPQDKEE